jgi:hypothetical protein
MGSVPKLLEEFKPDAVLVFEKSIKVLYRSSEISPAECCKNTGGSTATARQGGKSGDALEAQRLPEFDYCHSQVLAMCSPVLRVAIQSTDNSSSSTGDWEGKKVIPLPGTSKQQWMHIAPFLYPPAADVAEAVVDWDNLEAVLVLGHKYDMKGLLRKGSIFLQENSAKLDRQQSSKMYVWKWLNITGRVFGSSEPVLSCIKSVARLYSGTRVGQKEIEGLTYDALKLLLLQGCLVWAGHPCAKGASVLLDGVVYNRPFHL